MNERTGLESTCRNETRLSVQDDRSMIDQSIDQNDDRQISALF